MFVTLKHSNSGTEQEGEGVASEFNSFYPTLYFFLCFSFQFHALRLKGLVRALDRWSAS